MQIFQIYKLHQKHEKILDLKQFNSQNQKSFDQNMLAKNTN